MSVINEVRTEAYVFVAVVAKPKRCLMALTSGRQREIVTSYPSRLFVLEEHSDN